MFYSMHFGWDLQKNLQKRIRERHFGELLVGAAEVAETGDSDIPYCIAAPTMRVPMILAETPNAYLAARAVFLLLLHGKFDSSFGPALDGIFVAVYSLLNGTGKPYHSVIQTVAFPGLGTGVGRVPYEVCARQVRAAYLDHACGQYQFPATWSDAQVNSIRFDECTHVFIGISSEAV